MKRNILLCVAGMSPQIITETLYALTQNQKVKIDEIRVITTLDGKNKVTNTLLDKENGVFYKFCRDFGIDENSIKFDETCLSLFHKRDGKMLEDIRTQEDNEIAGDKICEIVRELCKVENTRIYASAAGGRKTMSIYLTLAMSLFGRAEDELSHVLVNEGFESNTFFYPPPTPTEIDYFNPQTKITKKVNTSDAKIYLAPIPFIRFRGIDVNLLDSKNSETYKQAVDKAQIALKEKETANYEFRIDLKKETVKVVEINSNLSSQVKLTLREIFVVTLFANFRLKNVGQNGFLGWKEITDKHLHQTCEQICLARGQTIGDIDFSFLPKSEFINKLHFETAKRLFFQKKCERFEKVKGRKPGKGEIGLTKKEIKAILEVWVQILGKMNKKFDAVFPQIKTFEQFYIQRDGEKESHTYGYKIAPQHIKFEN
jgi:CRISPR-associated protein (TIGR02584 family)